MIVFIIIWIIGIVLTFMWAIDGADIIGGLFFTLLLGGLLAAFLNLFTSFFVEANWREVSNKELVTLQDNVASGGSFFLGTGYVEGEGSFFWYEKNSNGGYKLESVRSKYATVFESDYPHVVELRAESTNLWISLWAEPMNDYKVNLYVPEGSIVSNYVLDAK